MALPSVDYAPRDPAADVLHRVVREHLQTFLAEAAHLRDGEGVPRFVEEEFKAFLSCGRLAGGFARFRCVRCQTERLVAFSCSRWLSFNAALSDRDEVYVSPVPPTGERLQVSTAGGTSARWRDDGREL